MLDLVSRLRSGNVDAELLICDEAADEIERLRGGVAEFLEWWDHGDDSDEGGETAFKNLRALLSVSETQEKE